MVPIYLAPKSGKYSVCCARRKTICFLTRQ